MDTRCGYAASGIPPTPPWVEELSIPTYLRTIGVGGVGKTRLALEVATQLSDEFINGVWVFELAAVADPAAVPDAVALVGAV